MKWYDTYPATKKYNFIQSPKYKEEEWYFIEDVLDEIGMKTGIKVSQKYVRDKAKELNLIKKEKGRYNLYHKSIVDVIIQAILN